MKLKVNLPGILEVQLKLAPTTLLLGPPKAGKTVLLRLIYDVFYLKREGRTPKDLLLMLQAAGRAEEWKLLEAERGGDKLEVYCSKEGCEARGSLSLNPLFVPREAEAIVKHRFVPPFEPYYSFAQLLSLLEARFMRKPQCPSGVKTEYKVVPTGTGLAEEVDGRLIDISLSSTAVARLGVLLTATA